jgi:hypothetical protein
MQQRRHQALFIREIHDPTVLLLMVDIVVKCIVIFEPITSHESYTQSTVLSYNTTLDVIRNTPTV